MDDYDYEDDDNDDNDNDYNLDDDTRSAYGLVYDSINDNYKIFRIDMYVGYEILSLKNGSWKIIDEISADRADSCMLSGWECLAFVHGAFHWIGYLSRKYCLVSFNISDEMFGEIQQPDVVRLQIHIKSIVDVDVGISVLGGMLGVSYKNEKAFGLWLTKNYGVKDFWMKLSTIPSTEIYSIIPKYMFSNYKVLLCFRFDEARKRFVYRAISGGSSKLNDRIWKIMLILVQLPLMLVILFIQKV
ncbi:putative carotenoid 9,10(9',10')-cleavage dioxygenase 1-like [Capsicum annuum]|nr:putative carotenoid 9,10(9',10')-cleavage dioxygenase 1-like [Capsicum annuum]